MTRIVQNIITGNVAKKLLGGGMSIENVNKTTISNNIIKENVIEPFYQS